MCPPQNIIAPVVWNSSLRNSVFLSLEKSEHPVQPNSFGKKRDVLSLINWNLKVDGRVGRKKIGEGKWEGYWSFAQGIKKNRPAWDQSQGHRESKGLFTHCVLQPKQDNSRGTGPEPRLKSNFTRNFPTPRPSSGLALVLGSGQQHHSLEEALALPAKVLPRACTTLVQRRGKPDLGPSLPRRKAFKPFLPREVALHSHASPPPLDR
jgi:hypothetical protein